MANSDLTPSPIKDLLVLTREHNKVIGELNDHQATFSSRVADVLERYAVSVYEALPDFEDNEWMAICDQIGTNYISIAGTEALHSYFTEFCDDDGFVMSENLNEKWGVNTDDIASRIYNMSMIQKIAIVEFIDRFWTWKSLLQGASDWGEIVSRIKESIYESKKNVASLKSSKFYLV